MISALYDRRNSGGYMHGTLICIGYKAFKTVSFYNRNILISQQPQLLQPEQKDL